MKTRLRWIALVVGLLGLGLWLWPRGYCRSARSKYGIKVPQCPDGTPRQTLQIYGYGLQRNGEGTVSVSAEALYTVAKADSWRQADIPSFDATLSLVDDKGQETPLAPAKGWTKSGYNEKQAVITLPEVRDGDYLLRARVSSKVGQSEVDLPLALYAPARIHTLTDRPLYEPGHEVKFRALAVRARDLTPIDHRPGTWMVRDPSGEILLEEKAPAGEWGVVAGSFPLDRDASIGTWTVTWESGSDQGQASFKVEPFTLPRFRVEALASEPFYQPGHRPRLTGQVTYSSGAPVTGAVVDITWRSLGTWPPPNQWLDRPELRQVTSDAGGRFVLDLPEIPRDLQGQVTLVADMTATDPAGDRVQGTASILLSQDAISAQAVTELAGGLVEGANNRLYLRVTTADGRVLSGATLKVRRAWAAADESIVAEADTDGVARIQLDPGPPVNVVIPAMPVREVARGPGQIVALAAANELIRDEPPSLADQLEMDRWLAALKPCAKWVAGSARQVAVGLRVSAAGAVIAATSGTSALERCVRAVVQTRRLPRGSERLYALEYELNEPDLPRLDVEVVSPEDVPEELQELFAEAALDARDCLPRLVEGSEGDLPAVLAWQMRAGSAGVQGTWAAVADSERLPAATASCVLGRVSRRALAKPLQKELLGVVRYTLSDPYQSYRPPPPQPTIMKGYELLVSAEVAGKVAGETRLRMAPGEIPDLRLRATPVLAKPGETVTINLIRGPSFTGDLPKELALIHVGARDTVKVDAKARAASFTVPRDGKGWYEVIGYGERALVYVRSEDDLELTLAPEDPKYPPGAMARIGIKTRVGGKGERAAVGLFGVDQSLSQIAPLPGADALGVLRPDISMEPGGFAALDAQALTLGRVRGDNAAEATVLRVASIPEPADLDVVIHSSAESHIDPVVELTDRFYVVLSELYAQARQWEASAPAGEIMQPATMAKLWDKALDAAKARGERIDDAFGRRLRLHRLPYDLLELTDPRNVIVVGTRLPEDVENWSQWVERNKP